MHGILHTADRLVRFGITVDPLYHCGAAELLVHLFTQCPVGRQIFALYQSLVKRAVSLTTQPSPSQLLVGYGRSMSIPPVIPCLLGIIRHRLWIGRNRVRFDRTPVLYSAILASVISSLRFVVKIQQRHCPRDLFIESWLPGGLLGYMSVENIRMCYHDLYRFHVISVLVLSCFCVFVCLFVLRCPLSFCLVCFIIAYHST